MLRPGPVTNNRAFITFTIHKRAVQSVTATTVFAILGFVRRSIADVYILWDRIAVYMLSLKHAFRSIAMDGDVVARTYVWPSSLWP